MYRRPPSLRKHRESLLFRFFLREEGRLYTGYNEPSICKIDWKLSQLFFKQDTAGSATYSLLSPCRHLASHGHPVNADKSQSPPPPGEMHKEMTVTNSDPAITNSRYYGNADTFLPPSARFHLVFSLAVADTWILRQKSGLIGWCDILYQLISRGKRLVFYLSRRDCHVITVSGCLILTAVNSSWYGWLTKC